MTKKIIETDSAPKAVGTYSQGVKYGDTYYFSGILGIDPRTSLLKENLQEQLLQIMTNIDQILKSQKLSRENIIKTTIFMTDLGQFSRVNEAYKDFFSAPYPARSCIEASRLPKDALIEIEVIAGE
ncbi:MAG: Rid family detoxifying hydrolase [Bacteriovoracaceae bacterium]|nr:Rid family detoxifying hydrolase [Bacteriovoracaceae bacterium]